MLTRLAFDSKSLAEATGFNKNDITYFIHVGLLHPIKINSRYIFTLEDVQKMLEAIQGLEIKTKKRR